MVQNHQKNFMKKIIICLMAVGLLVCSFKVLDTKASATVNQIEGLYIFIQSKPASEYDYMGSVVKGTAWSGKPEEMLNAIIKKVKKEYPQATGVIFTNNDMDKADAIKFK